MSYVFSMWDKKNFGLNTSILKNNIISFQCGIGSHLIYIFYVHKEKLSFFNVGFETH